MNDELFNDIKHGKINNTIVWVCDYRRPDLDKKAIRNVPPTKCIVTCSSETNRKIYYSNSYLAPIGKNGRVTKKIIKIYDNTCYRGVNVFRSEKDCIEKWNEQVKDVMGRLQVKIDTAAEYWISEKKSLTNLLVK